MLLASGCNPWTTRQPTLWPRPMEVERRADQIQDPFPELAEGPDIGFRPLDYQKPRPEPLAVKDRAYLSYLKQQRTAPIPAGPPGTTMLPPPGYPVAPQQMPPAYAYPPGQMPTATGAPYPQAAYPQAPYPASPYPPSVMSSPYPAQVW